MRRPRITVGGLMGIILGFGIALHIALTTVRVVAAKEYHFHTWVTVQGDKAFNTLAAAERPPFWPRYWRGLLGLPWKSQPLCREVKGRLLDLCEFAHPEIRTTVGGKSDQIFPTQNQIDLQRRLSNQSP